MTRPAKVEERNTEGGSTFLDQIAGITPISGSPSLDEQFGNGRNPFNVSASELFRKDKLKQGGK